MPDPLSLLGFARLYNVPPQFLFAALLADLQRQPMPSLTSWAESSGVDAIVASQDLAITRLRVQLDEALESNLALREQLRDIQRIVSDTAAAGKDPPSEQKAARG